MFARVSRSYELRTSKEYRKDGQNVIAQSKTYSYILRYARSLVVQYGKVYVIRIENKTRERCSAEYINDDGKIRVNHYKMSEYVRRAQEIAKIPKGTQLTLLG